jgi:hypothetical protein
MITLPTNITLYVKTINIPKNPRVVFVDDGTRVGARIENLNAIILWQGNDYQSIGDWTQAQAESRLMEVLGNDPATVLQSAIPAQ